MVASAERVARPLPRARGVYLGMSLLMVGIVAFGFWPSYFGLLMGEGVAKPLFIHVHAMVYVGWMGLFVTQTALVATRRVALHRQLGQAGMALGLVVLAVGVVTALLTYGRMVDEGSFEEARQFVVWPLLDMVIFAAFFIPAIAYRHKTALHKRFMVVAVTNLLVAAVFRGIGFETAAAHFVSVLVWLSPILIAMAYDFVSARIVHPVYVAGAAVLAVSSFRGAVVGTEPWLAFAEWLARVVT